MVNWVTVENRLTPDYIKHGWWMRKCEGCMLLLWPGTSLKCQPMLRCSIGSAETPIQTLSQLRISPCRFHEGGPSLLILEPAFQASQQASWQKSLSSRKKICFLSSVIWQRQLIEIQLVNLQKAAHNAMGLFLDGLNLLHRFERIQN